MDDVVPVGRRGPGGGRPRRACAAPARRPALVARPAQRGRRRAAHRRGAGRGPARRCGGLPRPGARYAARVRAVDAALARCFARVPAAQRKLVTDHDAFGWFAAPLRDRRRRRGDPLADDAGARRPRATSPTSRARSGASAFARSSRRARSTRTSRARWRRGPAPSSATSSTPTALGPGGLARRHLSRDARVQRRRDRARPDRRAPRLRSAMTDVVARVDGARRRLRRAGRSSRRLVRGARRRAPRGPRPQRRRQDDAVPGPARPARAAGRERRRRGARGHRPADRPLAAGLPGQRAGRRPDGHAARPAVVAAGRAGRARARRWTRWTPSACATWPTRSSAACRAASASACSSPAPWSSDSRLLLLDEPFSGLDAASAARLESLLGELAAEGRAVAGGHPRPRAGARVGARACASTASRSPRAIPPRC